MGMRVYTEWAGEEVELQEETFSVNGWVGGCVRGGSLYEVGRTRFMP